MRIVFAGTPDFSVPTLNALLNSEHQVVAVYTQPDRPAGRGRKLTPSPVKLVAESTNIPVYQPVSLREQPAIDELAALKPELMVVVAYGLLLPQVVLDIPSIACINIHASLLPRWRGAAPIQRAIIEGDHQTGVTIMLMEAKLDTGPILLQRTIAIEQQTSAELFEQLAGLGAQALLDALPALEAGKPEVTVQDESQSNYARKLSKPEAQLDWTLPASVLARQIAGYNPWPVATTQCADKTLRIWRAQAVSDVNSGSPEGTVLADTHNRLLVATGKGVLELLEVQLPGGKRLLANQFLNAQTLEGIQLV